MQDNPEQIEAFLETVANEVTEQSTRGDGERERERERDRTRDRERDRDRDRDRARDYRDRDRDRDRIRDRDRDRRPRESNGDRHSSRDRDRRRRDGSRPRSSKDADTDEESGKGRRGDRGGDYYRGGGRSTRSRSPRGRRDRSRSRDRDRVRDEGRRGRRRSPTPPPNEDEKDKRTVFVQQITQRAATRDLLKFFEVVGPVVDAQIVKDRVTGRSKGVGYVEFKDESSVAKAIDLTGQKLKGIPLIVQLTEAEKNRASREAAGGAAPGQNGAPFHRLYVGNIHFNVSEDDLRDIFAPYGELEAVTLQRDESNPARSKGYGFVQYVNPAHARTALSEMNNFELAGRSIRVGLGNDKFTPESTANLLRNFPAQQQAYQGSAFSGAGGRGAYAGGAGGMFDRTHGKDDRGVSGASALDDSDVSGVNFRQYDRYKLMNSLARKEDGPIAKQDAPAPVARSRRPNDDAPMATRCVKIQDVFNPDDEYKLYGADWVTGLEREIENECSSTYGRVVHLAVDPQSDGDVYVKFETLAGSKKAIEGLNGRRFNGHPIRASYVVDQVYNSLYPQAASK